MKKRVWITVSSFLILISVILIIAAPSIFNPGHDKEDIGNIKVINNFECVTGGYFDTGEKRIFNSTLNQLYSFDSIFNGTDYGNYVGIGCIDDNGWLLTGCSATTVMSDKGNDEEIKYNECKASVSGADYMTARCCRIILSDYSGANWQIQGHNASDISNLNKNFECLSGSYNENGTKTITSSNLENTYNFDNIFLTASVGNSAEIETQNGWLMTDCGSVTFTNDNLNDNDEFMVGANKCKSLNPVQDTIFVRACRLSSSGQGNPSFGHDVSEIGNIPNSNLECLSGSYNENGTKLIEISTLGNSLSFANVFETEITSFSVDGDEPVIGCINEWILVGCSSATLDTDNYDNDEYMTDKNKCRGDQRGDENIAFARCCRLV